MRQGSEGEESEGPYLSDTISGGVGCMTKLHWLPAL